MVDQYYANLDRPGVLNEDLDAHIADNILNKAQDIGAYVPNELKNDLIYLLENAVRDLHTEFTPIVTQEMSATRLELINGTDYTIEDYNNEIATEVERRISNLEYVMARAILNIAKQSSPVIDRTGDQRFSLTQRSMVDVQTMLFGFSYTMANPLDESLNDLLFSSEGLENLEPETLTRIYDSISQNGDSIIEAIQLIAQATIDQVHSDIPDNLKGSVQLLTILKILAPEQQEALVSHILNNYAANPERSQEALVMLTQNNFVSGAMVSSLIDAQVTKLYDQPLNATELTTRIARLESLKTFLNEPNPQYQAALTQGLQDAIVSLGIATHDGGNPALSGKSWLEFIGFYASVISGILGGAVCIGSGAGTQALLQYLPNVIVAKSAYEGMQGNGYIDWVSRLANGFNLSRDEREARDVSEWRDLAFRETLTGNLEQTKFFASNTVTNLLAQSINLGEDEPSFNFDQFETRLQNTPALYRHYQDNLKTQYSGNLDGLRSKLTTVAFTFHYLNVEDHASYIQNVAQYRNFTAENIPNLG